jgi:hypothetical protein
LRFNFNDLGLQVKGATALYKIKHLQDLAQSDIASAPLLAGVDGAAGNRQILCHPLLGDAFGLTRVLEKLTERGKIHRCLKYSTFWLMEPEM